MLYLLRTCELNLLQLSDLFTPTLAFHRIGATTPPVAKNEERCAMMEVSCVISSSHYEGIARIGITINFVILEE